MPQIPLVHVYTGNGKGKTTAAVGLCIRALGHGKRVFFCQFLKDNRSGELVVLKNLPGLTVCLENPLNGFFRSLPADQQESVLHKQHEKWEQALSVLESGGYELAVFDEIMAAVSLGCIQTEEILHFLKNRPQGLEVVLTGRNPPEALCDAADYVSNIDAVKHPYSKGIAAREGIEF